MDRMGSSHCFALSRLVVSAPALTGSGLLRGHHVYRDARGFIYLAAAVDWFSQRVLASRVSTTLEAKFCIEAVTEALACHGKPDI